MEAVFIGPQGQTTLSSTPLTLGRAAGNQLVVHDGKASSHHAEVRQEGVGYSVIDLGSTNGTYVNDVRLQPHVPQALNNGDRVRIGDTTFTYEVSGPAAIEPTVYAGPRRESGPAYEPTVAVPPPSYADYNAQPQQSYPRQQPMQPSPPAYPQQPPAYPQQPPQPQYNQGAGLYPPPVQQPPQKKGNRTLWLVLSIVGGVVLLSCIVCGVLSYVIGANSSTPEKTFTAYCDAMKNKDYPTAYDQFSSAAKSQTTEEKFASQSNLALTLLGGLSSCSISNVQINGSTATGTVTYTFGNGKTQSGTGQFVDESGTWKINGSLQQNQ